MPDHARRLCEATAAVVGFLHDELQGGVGDPAPLQEALAGLGLGHLRMDYLWGYFAEHPDGLTSGRSDGPASRLYLLRALGARYPAQVALPRCGGCERAVRLPQMGEDGQRRCAACYARQHVEECVLCGHSGRIARRDPQGRAICASCTVRDQSRWETCSTCGKTARVAARTIAGPVCSPCWPRRLIICAGCGKERPHCANLLCSACTARARRYECSLCLRRLAAAPRRGPGNERICDACWTPPPTRCRGCKEMRVIKNGGASGNGICNQCERALLPRRECAECGRVRHTHMHLPIGGVCSGCAFRLRHTLAPCTTCGELRPLIGRDSQGRRICGPCTGDSESWTCPTCGQVRFRFSSGRCITCTARQSLGQVVSTAAGQTHPQLHDLATVFDVDQHPHAVLSWVRKTKSAQTLSRLAQGGDDLTHEVLDAEPAGKHVDYLRQLLIFASVLPARHEAVEGTKKWLTDWLADADHDTAVLLRRYATWSLLRRARARHRRQSPVNSKNLRRRISTARQWLEWLNEHGTSLADANQGHVDQWLTEGKQTRYELRDFVLWTQREQLCGPLHVPFRQRGQPHQFLTEDRRWAALRRCANDDSIPLATRAAGGLVLLFGFAPGRLVRLTVNDVMINEGEALLKIGRAPLPLPEPIAAVIRKQVQAASTARTQVVLPQPDAPDRWLFPSEKSGQHADAGRLVLQPATTPWGSSTSQPQRSPQPLGRGSSRPDLGRRSRHEPQHRRALVRTRPAQLGRLRRRTCRPRALVVGRAQRWRQQYEDVDSASSGLTRRGRKRPTLLQLASQLDPRGRITMSSTSGPRLATRVLLFVVITVVALAVLVGGLVVVGYVLLANPFCAKPPTQQERSQQEAFVLAHLPDARGFEWTVADCDDNGQASVDFTTRQRGISASKAFLRDPACKASTEPDASSGDVTCTSGNFEVSVYIEDKGAIDTHGELAINQR